MKIYGVRFITTDSKYGAGFVMEETYFNSRINRMRYILELRAKGMYYNCKMELAECEVTNE